MKFARTFTAIIALGVICAPLARGETIRVYHIGNSLTDNINYGGLRNIAASEKDTYVYGKDVSPGVPLDYTWAFKTKTGHAYSIPPYGLYNNALKNYTWDALTLEPFDNWIKGSTGDLQISENFINYALKKSPNIQTYIYSRWPRRKTDSSGNIKPIDFTKAWTTPYTGSVNRYDLSAERKGYFETLVNDINKAMPKLKKKVEMVPVGDVFAELDKRVKAHQITGISDISQFYQDTIHMNKTGSYVIGLTFYATMYKKSPIGSAVPGAYGSINSKLAGELQDAVWQVVTTNPFTGVHATLAKSSLGTVVPEPMTLGVLILVPLLQIRRRSHQRG
jgi:hypothetical protein